MSVEDFIKTSSRRRSEENEKEESSKYLLLLLELTDTNDLQLLDSVDDTWDACGDWLKKEDCSVGDKAVEIRTANVALNFVMVALSITLTVRLNQISILLLRRAWKKFWNVGRWNSYRWSDIVMSSADNIDASATAGTAPLMEEADDIVGMDSKIDDEQLRVMLADPSVDGTFKQCRRLAYKISRRKYRVNLIVVPSTAISVWKTELARYFKTLRVKYYVSSPALVDRSEKGRTLGTEVLSLLRHLNSIEDSPEALLCVVLTSYMTWQSRTIYYPRNARTRPKRGGTSRSTRFLGTVGSSSTFHIEHGSKAQEPSRKRVKAAISVANLKANKEEWTEKLKTLWVSTLTASSFRVDASTSASGHFDARHWIVPAPWFSLRFAPPSSSSASAAPRCAHFAERRPCATDSSALPALCGPSKPESGVPGRNILRILGSTNIW